MPKPTAATPPDQPRRHPIAGERVRHISTGHLGHLDHFAGDGVGPDWALVRWDDDGPGMVDQHGLSRVAPGLLQLVTR